MGSSLSTYQNTNYVNDIIFDTNTYEPTNTIEASAAMKIVANKAAMNLATFVPPSATLENSMVTSTLHAFVNKGIDVANMPAVKTGLIGIAILMAGGVIYYGGKFICDKIVGDNKKVQLQNNPINDNSDVKITYNDERIVNLSGNKVSGDLNWRDISKIEIQ